MRLRPLLFVLVLSLALLGVAQSAPAQVVGEKQGVTVVRGSHGYVIRFSKRAAKVYRRIAGRRVIVGCGTVVPTNGGFSVGDDMSTLLRAPRKRHSISTLREGSDFCTIRLRAARELVVILPVTANGRTFIDELFTAFYLDLPFLSLDDSTDAPPSVALVLERGRGAYVALDGPDGTPPAGKVGYWTDGVRWVTAALTTAGRRLFIDQGPEVITTNVLPYLLNDW